VRPAKPARPHPPPDCNRPATPWATAAEKAAARSNLCLPGGDRPVIHEPGGDRPVIHEPGDDRPAIHEEAVVLTAERIDYVELLEGLPPFTACTEDDLEIFVAHDVMRVRCGPGEVLCGLDQAHNLYVLASGSAEMRVGPDVSIDLEPGDYFGQHAQRHHGMAGTVVAVTDIEVMVIGPQDLGRLALGGAGR
jgi:hypothetical protein